MTADVDTLAGGAADARPVGRAEVRTAAPEPKAGGVARSAPSSGRAVVVCELWLGSNSFAGLKALRRAGWSAHVVPEREFVPLRWRGRVMRAMSRMIRSAAVAEFNAELLRLSLRVDAEFLLVFKGAFVRASTLDALRRHGVRAYCFYPDVSFRAHGTYLPQALPHYDWIFTTKSFGLRDLRDDLRVSRASLLLHAFDPDLHRPVELTEYEVRRFGCDVSFIGTWSPKKERLLAALVELRPELMVRVWGEQWERASSPALRRGAIGGHEIVGEDYVRAICASAINLGLLSERRRGASGDDQVTSRTFHIPACGGFMLHERTPEVLDLFSEDEHVACFSDVDELVDRVDRYLEDVTQRRSVAEAGHDIVWANHSWDHRIQVILNRHRGHAE